MPTAKITKRSVESLEIQETYNHLWDTDLKGFGVRVTPKSKRVYIIQRPFNLETLYLACSDLNLDGADIWTIYKKRWKVEEFHKSLK